MHKKLATALTIFGVAIGGASAIALGIIVYAWTPSPEVTGSQSTAPSSIVVAQSTTANSETSSSSAPEIGIENPTAPPNTESDQTAFDALVDRCMADQGYAEAVKLWRQDDLTLPIEERAWYKTYTSEQRDAFDLALLGDPHAPIPRHWTDTGCTGQAHHELGGDARQ